MFSTSPFIPSVIASLEALNMIDEQDTPLVKLWENIGFMKESLLDLGFNIGNTETAIIPIILGDDNLVMEMTHRLHQRNVFVNPVPYPAVPRKLTRVRLTVTAGFSRQQLTYAIQCIKEVALELGILK